MKFIDETTPENYDGYKALAFAIVEHAVDDYRNALMIVWKHKANPDMPFNQKIMDEAIYNKKDCERFFNDEEYVYMLCEMSGRSIMHQIQRQVREKLESMGYEIPEDPAEK